MRAPRSALAALAGLSLVAGAFLTARAASAGPVAPAFTPGSVTGDVRTVTLPTGDKLEVRTDPAGHPLVTPATPGLALETRTIGDDLYAIPLSAIRAQGNGMDVSRYDVSALLRGETTAPPPAAHPDFPMRTLTVNVIDDRGRPADDAAVQVMNVDDIAKHYSVRNVTGGVAKVSVPDGNYSLAVPTVAFADDGTPTTVRLAFADVTVAGGPATAAVDLRSATHLVSADTPRAADLISQDLTWFRGSGEGTAGTAWGWGMPGSTRFYVGDDPATAGVQHFYLHDRFESPAGTAKPYAYDVEFPTDGALTGDQGYHATDAGLATVDTRYHGDTPQTGFTTLFGILPWEQGVGRGIYPVTEPLRRTEYLTGGQRLRYAGVLVTTGDATAEQWSSYTHAYQPGEHTTADWAQGPLAPGLPADTGADHYFCPACREDDTLSVILSPLTDSDPAHFARLAPSGDGVVSTSRFQLYQGGTKLADQTDVTGGDLTVGADPADYRVVYDQTRTTPNSTLSTGSHSEWTFRSRHSGATTVPGSWLCGTTYTRTDCSAVPLLTFNYQLPQGLDGTVGTGPEQLTLNVGHSTNLTAPAVRAATVAVSYDQGATWTVVPVACTGAGTFRALWNNTSATAGKTVSLKVTAKDG
jgi:hypothetical protein